MELCVKEFLTKKGYTVNDKALEIVKDCDDWYANRKLDFHKRSTVQGISYELNQLNMAKRCCSDDANLCEVVEINTGKENAQFQAVKDILTANNFDTMYRSQLEKTSATGTVACYIRIENVQLLDTGKTKGGEIKINYVDAAGFIPLTVENNQITEAAFSGSDLVKGKKQTTLVLFLLVNGIYSSETHIFDEWGKESVEGMTVNLGNVKPFAVLRNAEVNNLDNMDGYGLPKVLNAIPIFKALDLAFNILYGDIDKGEKLLLVNEVMCKFDADGKAITPNEQAKKTFVLLGEKLPDTETLVKEYNPEIRIEQITSLFELLLSLLSMSFGYGTKKYTFDNGQIATATEYIGERQDSMQELNRQRFETTQYISDIVKAILWFANTYQGAKYDQAAEIVVSYDDSYITDKASELDRKRNDALSFDIPKLKIWYLMDAYGLDEKEATALVTEATKPEEDTDPTD